MRDDKSRKTFIRTFTGKTFYPLAPRFEDIDIRDIAHSLAQQCRWTGHTKRFYSVAQHSVHVSERVPVAAALSGLLHDAQEAYCSDLSRPLKHDTPMGREYMKIEEVLERAIAEKFKIEFPHPSVVKLADDRILWTEMRDLMEGKWDDRWVKKFDPYPETLTPWSSEEAERRFLQRFAELTGQQPEALPLAAATSAGAAFASLRKTVPESPSNSFLLSQYARDNGISITLARAQIAKLRDAGKIRPVVMHIMQSNGRVSKTSGWQIVPDSEAEK